MSRSRYVTGTGTSIQVFYADTICSLKQFEIHTVDAQDIVLSPNGAFIAAFDVPLYVSNRMRQLKQITYIILLIFPDYQVQIGRVSARRHVGDLIFY
jgi:hypothetical protein